MSEGQRRVLQMVEGGKISVADASKLLGAVTDTIARNKDGQPMSEEQLRVLQMVEDGKISVEDAAKLLGAISDAIAARERQGQEKESSRENRRGRRGFGWDEDPFWGTRQDSERDRMRAERDRMRAERDRMRAEARNQANSRRGAMPPIPPIPPMPPIPPVPPTSGRRADTEPLGGGSSTPRYFRVRVSDRASGEPTVDLRLPLGMINFGLKMAARYLPEEIAWDADEVQSAITTGVLGKILEVNDPEGDSRVEITIEG